MQRSGVMQVGVYMLASAVIAAVFGGFYIGDSGASTILNAKADIDSRRIAQAIEVADHRPESITCVNFDIEYTTDLSENSVSVETQGVSATHPFTISSNLDTGSVGPADDFCIVHTPGGMVPTADCDEVEVCYEDET